MWWPAAFSQTCLPVVTAIMWDYYFFFSHAKTFQVLHADIWSSRSRFLPTACFHLLNDKQINSTDKQHPPPTPTSNVCRWTHMATVGSKKDPVERSPRCNKTCWSVRSHPSIFTPESISRWDETLLYGMNKGIRWEERSSCEGVSKWLCRFVSEGQRSQRRCIKGKEDGECIHVQSDPSWSTCGWGVGGDLCNMFSIT